MAAMVLDQPIPFTPMVATLMISDAKKLVLAKLGVAIMAAEAKDICLIKSLRGFIGQVFMYLNISNLGDRII
jgi:hypothetical protein